MPPGLPTPRQGTAFALNRASMLIDATVDGRELHLRDIRGVGSHQQEARLSAGLCLRKFRQPPHLRFPTRWPLSYDVARRVTARRQLGETKDAFP